MRKPVAVESFCQGKITFPAITETVRRTMDVHRLTEHPDLETILAADAWARETAARG